MTSYLVLLALHLLGATVWTGGHLVLAVRVLPRALRARDPEPVRAFERAYEAIGLPALLVQVVTGVLLALGFSGGPGSAMSHGYERAIGVKLGLLLVTAGLALNARFRIIPRLDATRLVPLAWHIVAVTFASIAFVLVGLSFRAGGLP